MNVWVYGSPQSVTCFHLPHRPQSVSLLTSPDRSDLPRQPLVESRSLRWGRPYVWDTPVCRKNTLYKTINLHLLMFSFVVFVFNTQKTVILHRPPKGHTLGTNFSTVPGNRTFPVSSDELTKALCYHELKISKQDPKHRRPSNTHVKSEESFYPYNYGRRV